MIQPEPSHCSRIVSSTLYVIITLAKFVEIYGLWLYPLEVEENTAPARSKELNSLVMVKPYRYDDVP